MSWSNANFNPNKRDDQLLLAEVVSRRQHSARPRGTVDPLAAKEESVPSSDIGEILAKSSEGRLRWLQRVLPHVSTGKVKVTKVYDIVAHPKFAKGATTDECKQMNAVLLGNLQLFSQKQQRFFQSDASCLDVVDDPDSICAPSVAGEPLGEVAGEPLGEAISPSCNSSFLAPLAMAVPAPVSNPTPVLALALPSGLAAVPVPNPSSAVPVAGIAASELGPSSSAVAVAAANSAKAAGPRTAAPFRGSKLAAAGLVANALANFSNAATAARAAADHVPVAKAPPIKPKDPAVSSEQGQGPSGKLGIGQALGDDQDDSQAVVDNLPQILRRSPSGEKEKVSPQRSRKSRSRKKKKHKKARSSSSSSTEKERSASRKRKRSTSRAKKRTASRKKRKSSSRDRKRSSSRKRKKSASRGRRRSGSGKKKKSASRDRKRSASRKMKRSASRDRKKSASREKKRSTSREKKKKKKGSRSRSQEGKQAKSSRFGNEGSSAPAAAATAAAGGTAAQRGLAIMPSLQVPDMLLPTGVSRGCNQSTLQAAQLAAARRLQVVPIAVSALRPGDWFCPICNAHNYASKFQCFRCIKGSNPLLSAPGLPGPPMGGAWFGAF